MPTPLRRTLAHAFYWQHPLTGVIALPLLLGFAVWVFRQLSPLASVPGDNHAAALGIITSGGIGLAYIGLRLGGYALARRRGGLADGAPDWNRALIDAARGATVTLLVILVLLAPVLGRQGSPPPGGARLHETDGVVCPGHACHYRRIRTRLARLDPSRSTTPNPPVRTTETRSWALIKARFPKHRRTDPGFRAPAVPSTAVDQ